MIRAGWGLKKSAALDGERQSWMLTCNQHAKLPLQGPPSSHALRAGAGLASHRGGVLPELRKELRLRESTLDDVLRGSCSNSTQTPVLNSGSSGRLSTTWALTTKTELLS